MSDVLLHFIHSEEMTADVEHRAPVGEAGLIGDANRGNTPVVPLDPPCPIQCRRANSCLMVWMPRNKPAGLIGDEADRIVSYREVVSFLAERRSIRSEAQND